MADRISIFSCGGINLYSLPLERLFGKSGESFRHVVTVHAEIFVHAHTDQKLNKILQYTINTIDGRVLQGLCKLLYPADEILRQNGANFTPDLARHCVAHSQRLFLLGSTPNANVLAGQALRHRFPGIQVSGFSPSFGSYPFDPGWNAAILHEIERYRPHQLIVCFGPLKQEYWIHENADCLSRLGVLRAYGLGGTIDFLAGVKPRVPKWMEFIGTEWLFRLLCEPRARFGRTLTMFKMPYYVSRTPRRIRYITPDEYSSAGP